MMDTTSTWEVSRPQLSSSSAAPTFHTTPTVTKRPRNPAEDLLERDQRLSKRFGLLHLDAQKTASERCPPSRPIAPSALQRVDHGCIAQSSESYWYRTPQEAPIQNIKNSLDINIEPAFEIEVDDTPTRIHISSLPHEIASIEAREAEEKEQEARQVAYYLLPDVERRIVGLPRRLLQTEHEREIQQHIEDAERHGQKPAIEGLGLLPSRDNAVVLFTPTTNAHSHYPSTESGKRSRSQSTLPSTSSSVITLAGYGHDNGDYGDDDVHLDIDNGEDDAGAMEID